MKNWHCWPVTSHYPIFSYGSLNFGARNKAVRKSPSPNREPHCCIMRWRIIDWLATLASANSRFHIQLWFFEFEIMPKKNFKKITLPKRRTVLHYEMKNWWHWPPWPVPILHPIFSYGSWNVSAKNRFWENGPALTENQNHIALWDEELVALSTLASANSSSHIQFWFFEC
jgi:hypothetical protein